MKTLNCLIVDDSPEMLASLESLLEKYSFLKTVACNNLESAHRKLAEKSFDLMFLDIHLGSESGLDLIKKVDVPPTIILSSYSDYAAQTYELKNVIDYLLKPISETRLLKAIGRVIAQNYPAQPDKPNGGYCFLSIARKPTRFDFDSIDYIESVGTNCKIYYNNSCQFVNESISTIEQILPSSFRRVHKSFIVNLEKISSISLKSIEIKNNEVPIGASYRQKLYNLLNLFNVN